MTVSRAKAERALRVYARGERDYRGCVTGRVSAPLHVHRREGDEMACRCGKRWPIGEDHP